MIQSRVVILIICLLTLISCTPKPQQAILILPTTKISLELALTPSEQAQGLSDRKNMPEDHGMLFIFPQEQELTFWMKDMYFPLDIIWLNKNNEVVDISLNQQPCKPNITCSIIMPKVPAKSVVEVNAGIVEKYKIKIGQKLKLLYI